MLSPIIKKIENVKEHVSLTVFYQQSFHVVELMHPFVRNESFLVKELIYDHTSFLVKNGEEEWNASLI